MKQFAANLHQVAIQLLKWFFRMISYQRLPVSAQIVLSRTLCVQHTVNTTAWPVGVCAHQQFLLSFREDRLAY